MSQQSVTINPFNVPKPQPQFSQVNTFTIRGSAKIVAITGQLAIQTDPDKPTPELFDDQVRLALQNLENCLEAAGASKRDIFKVTHYGRSNFNTFGLSIAWLSEIGSWKIGSSMIRSLTDCTIVKDFDYMAQNPAQIFVDWLGIDHRPASCMMPVVRLAGPDWMYEIECWAIVPLSK